MNTIDQKNNSLDISTIASTLDKAIIADGDTTNFAGDKTIKIIEYAYEHYYLDYIIDDLLGQNVIGDASRTSCVNNAFAIMDILGLQEERRLIVKNMGRTWFNTIQFPLSQGKIWELEIADLLDNVIANKIDKTPGFKKLAKTEQTTLITDFSLPILKQFSNSYKSKVNPIVNDNSLSDNQKIVEYKIVFSKLNFNFNRFFIDGLEKEIATNHDLLLKSQSKDKAFLYTIVLKASPIKKNHDLNLLHICLLEQYYSAKTGDTCYRLHQSWINQSELRSTPMSHDKLADFLNKLRGLNCEINPNTGKKITVKECFGFGPGYIPFFLDVNAETGIDRLRGLSIRCCTREFNPELVIHNFAKTIDSSVKLTDLFHRMFHKKASVAV